MYLNKALIVGNLTRDPEMRALPSGMQVASLSVATNSVWRDKDGNKKEDTQFHNIVVFGRQAETAGQYLKKGQQVMVEGRIQTRSWDDKTSGEKKYRTEIVADRVQFGAKAGGFGGGTGDSAGAQAPAAKGGVSKAAAVDTIEYPSEDINPEDIPF
ncbi:MAG TPA: single-stranded DNA-binding protein [Candidatus Paceibacterota bacterium]|jgi:single-strand DNA-binding protein|nr:single-stranded DNA-binding protein [Candidatus Paceibacterota bacterium]